MRHIFTLSAFTALLSLFSVTASAFDIAVENEGVTFYYNFINDGKELEVTYKSDKYNSYAGVVVIPEEVIYSGKTYSVTSIEGFAFRGCSNLTSVTIPGSVTRIKSYAFNGCSNLTSVTIGNSVTTIGSIAFEGCSGLKKVIVKDIAAWCNINFGNGNANPLFYAQHLYSDENTEITNLIIPGSVTSIGEYAFYNCRDLTSVTIPNSVTTIGWGAFNSCSGLTSVTIPNSVTTIGNSAFSGCSGLTSVTIGNSVTTIGSSAFSGCSGLTSVTIPASIETIGEDAFRNDKALTDVICLRPRPIMIKANVFENVPVHGSCDLHVPVGSKVRYEAMDVWKEFAFIIEDADTWAPSSPYDLNGDGKVSTADIQVIINEMKK